MSTMTKSNAPSTTTNTSAAAAAAVSVPLMSMFAARNPQSLVRVTKKKVGNYIKRIKTSTRASEVRVKSVVHDKRPLEIARRYAQMALVHIEAVVRQLPSPVLNDDAELLSAVEPVWFNLLADFFHNYNPATDARNCSAQCLKKRTTLCLHADRALYGCWLHGYLHLCRASSTSCFVVHTNRDLTMNCVLSGRYLGYEAGDGGSTFREAGGSKKKQFDYYALLNRFQRARESTTNEYNSDAARIARLTGTFHRTQEKPAAQRLAEARAKRESEANSIPAEYTELVEKALAANEAPAAAAPLVASIKIDIPKKSEPKKAPQIHFSTAIELPVDELESKRVSLTNSLQRFALINASSMARGLVTQSIDAGHRVVREIIAEVFADIHRGENRVLYNTYCKHRAVNKATEEAQQLFHRARKQGTLVCAADLFLVLDTHNREFVELSPFVKHEPHYVERIIENITWLWSKCCHSPFVKAALTKNSETGVLSLSPSSDSMCSLRQFTLASLYYMCEGLTLAVPYSYTNETILLLAPHRALLLDLPPEEHACYFGAEAMIELRRCINNSLFANAADFNLNRVATTESESIAMTASAKRRKRSEMAVVLHGGGGGGVAATSTALTNSASIESSLCSIDTTRARKSRARKTLDEVVRMERSQSCASGRLKITSSELGGAVTSLTELQCTPFYMREPMLTGGSRYTRRNVYDIEDIRSARRFITLSLNSYEHRVDELRE